LTVSRLQVGQVGAIDQDSDAPSNPGTAGDQPLSFQCQQHLVNRRRCHLEEPLDIRLRWWTPVHQCVGVDKRQILSLPGRENRVRITQPRDSSLPSKTGEQQ